MPYAHAQGSTLDSKTLLARKRPRILCLAARYDMGGAEVFGSVARLDLEMLPGCKIRMVTEKGLRPRIGQRVADEAVPL
jgi:predicted nucleotidyltransferase